MPSQKSASRTYFSNIDRKMETSIEQDQLAVFESILKILKTVYYNWQHCESIEILL